MDLTGGFPRRDAFQTRGQLESTDETAGGRTTPGVDLRPLPTPPAMPTLGALGGGRADRVTVQPRETAIDVLEARNLALEMRVADLEARNLALENQVQSLTAAEETRKAKLRRREGDADTAGAAASPGRASSLALQPGLPPT